MESNYKPFSFQKIPGVSSYKVCQRQHKLWTFEEMIRYAFYLNDYLLVIGKKQTKTLSKEDFKYMSRVIKSRNANQCRIFHHNMLKIKGSISEIASFFCENIDSYAALYQEHQNKSAKKLRNNLSEQEECQILQQELLPLKQKRERKESFTNEQEKIGVEYIIPEIFDWEEEYSHFMASLNNSWLDDV